MNMKSKQSALVVLVAAVSLSSVGLAQSAWADNVATRWVSHALDVVRVTNQSTQAAGRIYALTGVAMYDAVNGIERERLKSVGGPGAGQDTGAGARAIRRGPRSGRPPHSRGGRGGRSSRRVGRAVLRHYIPRAAGPAR